MLAIILPVFGCGNLQAHAQEHGTAPAARRLIVKLEHGSIEVHGQPGLTQVEWSARGHHGSQGTVTATPQGDALVLHGISADLVVNVPMQGTQISLRSGSGDLTVTNVTANADVWSDGGNLKLDHVTGTVAGKTGGGNIALHTSGVAGQLSRLETGGGNVLVDAADGNVIASSSGGNVVVTAIHGNLKIDSGGGNVTVRQASGGVQLETGSGNVEMGDIGGEVVAKTGGGSIRLASAHGMVNAETGAGSIDCRQLGSGLHAETGAGAILAEYARTLHFLESKLETGSGNVTVWMPSTLAAAVKVTADNPWGHTIRTDFYGVQVTKSKENNELRAEGLMNGGGPLLWVETGNGDVELLRLK